MRKLPIGNDQPIRWAVTVSGKPFNLEGQDVHVYVVNSRGEIPLRSLKVNGAEVSGVFEGRYQTRLGEHSLILRVNEGRPEMKTASVANVFEIVKWSADAGGSDEGDVIITPVILESELSIGGVSYDDTELREAIKDLEQKKVNKTDLATINGQRIDEGGNIEIEASEGTLTAEEVSSTEPTAAFPQVLYTAQSLSDAQKSQARENIGVDKELEGLIGAMGEAVNGLAETIAANYPTRQEVSDAIAEIPAPEDEILVVEYGKTTFQEVYDAYTSEKYIVLEYKNNVFHINRVTASDIYFISVNGTIVYRITLNSSNNWYQNTLQNEQSTNKVTTLSESSTDVQYPSAKAVYDAIQQSGGTQGVISQTLNYNSDDNTYSVSDVVRGSIPSFFIDLVTEAGASFNAESGYFSLNGIDNIAYDEMRIIYDARTAYGTNSVLACYGAGYEARTNFAVFRGASASYTNHAPTTVNVKYLGYRNCYITKFAFCTLSGPHILALHINSQSINNFDSFGTTAAPLTVSRIEEIIGVIYVEGLTGSANFFYNGAYHPWMTTFYLKSLKASIDFSGMPRLSEATILYMINNEKATAAITIKLHADAKAMADASEAIQSALSNHANITLGV